MGGIGGRIPMTIKSLADIQAHKRNGPWRALERRATAMVEHAAHHAGAAFKPHLGGGTRLMLMLEHRISDDIDLFIRDPQWIGYLTPRLNDDVEQEVNDYSENAVSLKLRYDEGEIDFIVGMSLLGLPEEKSDDTSFILEPVAEVLAKKLFYRGWALTPRDIFDWWWLETRTPELIPTEKMSRLLKKRFGEIERSLSGITKNGAASTSWNGIRAVEKPELVFAAEWAKGALQRYIDVSNEVERRVAELPSLSRSAGAAYLFSSLADNEIQRQGSADRVDWDTVEMATIRESIGEHGQSPDAVIDALLKHSPGVITQFRKAAVEEMVKIMTPELQATYEGRGNLHSPTNGM